ncbi:MAG TPA: L,D-transpeptidase family protein [Stellaceae bacterium]|nr:L,D-transpeptidase family protein [Stellaceae bacterium]
MPKVALRLAALMLAAPILPAHAAMFLLAPGGAAIGTLGSYTTQAQDTFPDIARRYDLGYTQLVAANRRIDPWLPGQGTRVVLPSFYLLPDAPRRGIVVNLAAQRLYYFPPKSGKVETFPIGIGVQGWATPAGMTRVVAKVKDPTWYPPPSIRAQHPDLPRAIPPGPDDPLGDYALRLGWSDYLIHGTNKPDSVGRRVSHGCLHLYPADIERLFNEVPVGTPVRVINQQVETGWIGRQLYVAVHPSLRMVDAIDLGESVTPEPPSDLMARVAAAAGNAANRVDWAEVKRIGLAQSGIPTPVLQSSQQVLVSEAPSSPEP